MNLSILLFWNMKYVFEILSPRFKHLKGCLFIWDSKLRKLQSFLQRTHQVWLSLVVFHEPYSPTSTYAGARVPCFVPGSPQGSRPFCVSTAPRGPLFKERQNQGNRVKIKNKSKYQRKVGLDLVHLQIKLLCN